MTPTPVANRRVTVLGLGTFGGGIAVSRWLVEQGATVTVVDQLPAAKLADSVAQLAGLPITFDLGPTPAADHFAAADLVVASPAVPPTNEWLVAARSAGVATTTEVCLFAERCLAAVVGVTGTKGKSTTTELLGRMLATRFTTWVGGNIGRSLLAELPAIRPDHVVVLELSSFMLTYLGERRWSPHVAVVPMVAEDHLDWHGSLGHYLDAKTNLVRHQSGTDVAVLNAADPGSWRLRSETKARVVPFNAGADEPSMPLRIAGAHNVANARAALAAAESLGVSRADAIAAVADFAGLPHRLQVVADVGGVRWVNDSIATIPQATVAALMAYPAGRVIAIVGGSDKKHLPIDAMVAALVGRAKLVLCVGQTGPAVATAVGGRVPVQLCGDLATAVDAARAAAVPGDVVLLSPGYPSYDQFTNFQHRGDAFAAMAAGPVVDRQT